MGRFEADGGQPIFSNPSSRRPFRRGSGRLWCGRSVRSCHEPECPDQDSQAAAAPSARRRAGGESVPKPGLRLPRSEEHTSELQSLMRISYAVFCLKKKKKNHKKLKYRISKRDITKA